MSRHRAALIWAVLIVVIAVPIALAATSPQLAWRRPAYIAAGFAGITAMALLLLQPLLAGGHLPGLSALRGRWVHRWVGAGLVAALAVHVAGLWLTSPPDVIDALLFRSPTPFSVWGVLAMWAVILAALLALFRRRLRLRPRTWRIAHKSLALAIVTGSIAHALLIVGTMETVTKVLLCALVAIAALWAILDLPRWPGRSRTR